MTDREEAVCITVLPGEPGEPGETRIVVRGELDSAQAQEVAAAYSEALKRGELESATAGHQDQGARITLDLEEVDFIDSGGLRMLIVIQQNAEVHGVQLTVRSPPDAVTELLHLTGVAERVNLVRDGAPAVRESDFLEQVELEFDADDRAPSRARAAVRESLGGMLTDSALANIVLMTSELVTNGVVHSAGGRNVGLRLTTFRDAVRVEVDDPGAGFEHVVSPAAREAPPTPDQGGRGLFVVDRCSSRWGTRQADTDRGKRFSVWFELDTAVRVS